MKQPTFDDLMDLELSLGFKINKFVITKDKIVHATFIDVKTDNKHVDSFVTTTPFDYRKVDAITTITKELKTHRRHPHNKHKPKADNNG